MAVLKISLNDLHSPADPTTDERNAIGLNLKRRAESEEVKAVKHKHGATNPKKLKLYAFDHNITLFAHLWKKTILSNPYLEALVDLYGFGILRYCQASQAGKIGNTPFLPLTPPAGTAKKMSIDILAAHEVKEDIDDDLTNRAFYYRVGLWIMTLAVGKECNIQSLRMNMVSRVGAVMASLGVGTNNANTYLPQDISYQDYQDWREFLGGFPSLRAFILDDVRTSTGNADLMKAVYSQVILLNKGARMVTLHSIEQFLYESKCDGLLLPKLASEGVAFLTALNNLRTKHGEDFDFLGCVEHSDLDVLKKNNYPTLSAFAMQWFTSKGESNKRVIHSNTSNYSPDQIRRYLEPNGVLARASASGTLNPTLAALLGIEVPATRSVIS